MGGYGKMSRRVVVTGMGVVSPLGIGTSRHWEGLLEGRAAVTRLQRLSSLGFPVDVAAEAPADELAACLSRLPRKQIKLYNRATVFAMIAALLAAEDAGLAAPVEDPTRAGVILATLFIPYPVQTILRLLPGLESAENPERVNLGRALGSAMKSVNPLDMSLKIVPNLTAGHIAIHFGLRGLCRTVADGWTGGMNAIGQAMTAIREGHADLVVCGGTEAPLDDLVFADLCATGLLADPDQIPQRTCRPFGRERRGLVVGEGAAILILEAYEHACRRGARQRGEVTGFGAAVGDGTRERVLQSSRSAMRRALDDGGVNGVDLISANGDSTRVNDWAESGAICDIAGLQPGSPAVFATKGAHGSLVSAAAPLDVVTALVALEHGILPPSPSCDDRDPECGLRLSGRSAEPRPGLRTALVNALGAFGEAASVVVTRSA